MLFERLKRYLISASILPHFNPEGKIVVQSYVSNLLVTMILSKYDNIGTFHPMAHFSKKYLAMTINDEIYEKEPLAIISFFKEGYPLLEHSSHAVEVI
jgi:hypothetical protein